MSKRAGKAAAARRSTKKFGTKEQHLVEEHQI